MEAALTAVTELTTTEARLCQFWVRGRCNRENCEFRHEVETKSTAMDAPATPAAPIVAVKSTPAPSAPGDDTLALAEESVRDSSTFIAATDATAELGDKPLLVRRARNTVKKLNGNSDNNGGGLEVEAAEPEAEEAAAAQARADAAAAEIKQATQEAAVAEDSVIEVSVSEEPTREASVTESSVGNDGTATATEESAASPSKDGDGAAEESIESIVNFIQEGNTSVPQKEEGKSGEAAPPSKPQADGEKSNNEWVSEIFGQAPEEVPGDKQPATPKRSVYDLNPEGEDFSVCEATPFTAIQPKVEAGPEVGPGSPLAVKQDGVTKIGNNTYFYSGPKGEKAGEVDEDGEEVEMVLGDAEGGADASISYVTEGEDSQDEGVAMNDTEGEVAVAGELEPGEVPAEVPAKKPGSKKGVPAKSYADGRRRHSTNYVYGARSNAAKTRRCGECEGCNREDCGKCTACIDKPKFGGRGAKKQACHYRMCAWKNPSGKRIAPGAAPTQAPPVVPPVIPPPRKIKQEKNVKQEVASPASTGKGTPKRGRQSISVISPAPSKEKPRDDELPKFDPQKFKPGYTPPVVKKGDQEYNIIVSGVKDTGLCGKYWSDMEALPSRRRRTTVAEAQKAAAEEAAKAAAAASGSSAEKKRGGRKQSLKEKLEVNDANPSTTNPTATATGAEEEAEDDPPEPPTATPGVVKSGAGRKRKQEVNNGETEEPESKKAATLQTQQTETDQAASQQLQPEGQVTKTESRVPDNSSADNVQPADRNVSCIAGGSTEGASQREVVVECFAPYDDHRWVNIGKQRDGMAPDAVQYARALRPPYHLLSFLRVKGHSTKGMSCTDKNTMVFVVLEGEITVVLHTTQFNAKKGDSFYIPPKNYYDLINNKAREAELSLIQFQYDGPLPTVNAASQSGQSTAAAASAAASTSSQAAPPK